MPDDAGSRTGSEQTSIQLYVDEHDRINTWDLVDRAAPHVVGGYLHDRDRAPLYELACSSDPWRRRTSVVATWYFIRDGDLDDTFGLADLLAHDPEEVVQAAVGGFVREAGKRDPPTTAVLSRRQVQGSAKDNPEACDQAPAREPTPALPGSQQLGVTAGPSTPGTKPSKQTRARAFPAGGTDVQVAKPSASPCPQIEACARTSGSFRPTSPTGRRRQSLPTVIQRT